MKPRLKGRGFLVRYADDAVLLFSREEDARRVMEVLPKRFGKYGLTLHPEKTRLIEFQRPDRRPPRGGSSDRPGTFDLLGFTHYWGLSRKGKWVVKRKTARDRLSRALKRVAQWCRLHRHHPIEEQQQTLAQKLRGHFGYYGITGNFEALKHSAKGRARLAQVARSPLAVGTHDVGPHEETARAQSTPAGTHPAALFHRVANPCPEEPDAGILHVRIRGGRGRATSRGYPSKGQHRPSLLRAGCAWVLFGAFYPRPLTRLRGSATGVPRDARSNSSRDAQNNESERPRHDR